MRVVLGVSGASGAALALACARHLARLGARIDLVLSRVIEVVICFPSFFLIITVLALVDPSIWNIMIVIGLTRWTGVARLFRAEVLKVKNILPPIMTIGESISERRCSPPTNNLANCSRTLGKSPSGVKV